MSRSPEVVVHASPDLLADAVAARLITKLVDAQSARGWASLALTGGGICIAVLGALRNSPARDAVQWDRVDVWWGDERFIAADDPERNDLQAREALLDHVLLAPDRVHPMPADEGRFAGEPEDGAEWYADQLAASARPEDHGSVPRFDVCMLGIGEDGHVASIFPGAPAAYETRSVVAVHGSPKPPPVRISLTFSAIGSASEVWLVAAGAGKAAAVGLAVSGAGPVQIPAAGAIGRVRTMLLLDRAAATGLPAELLRLPTA
ncbi:MAG: 6-phosphogluconolactonase [Geodermatophilaceae bacterium]|nr:6-phosphogluconolactonase [Geodermatophilaceae bacterium]